MREDTRREYVQVKWLIFNEALVNKSWCNDKHIRNYEAIGRKIRRVLRLISNIIQTGESRVICINRTISQFFSFRHLLRIFFVDLHCEMEPVHIRYSVCVHSVHYVCVYASVQCVCSSFLFNRVQSNATKVFTKRTRHIYANDFNTLSA